MEVQKVNLLLGDLGNAVLECLEAMQGEVKGNRHLMFFGGNLAGLPGHVREQGCHLFKNMPGIYSGLFENAPGIYSGPPPGLSGEQQSDLHDGAGAQHQGPEQKQGGGAGSLDALVQGMTQLQAALSGQARRQRSCQS